MTVTREQHSRSRRPGLTKKAASNGQVSAQVPTRSRRKPTKLDEAIVSAAASTAIESNNSGETHAAVLARFAKTATDGKAATPTTTPTESATVRSQPKLSIVEPLHEVEHEEAEYESLADRKREAGDYSLRDLPYGPPPDLLADPFLDPEGPTVPYAPGGSGKGLVSLALIKKMLDDPRIDRIGVLDYENHEREWGWRARAMGFTGLELERVKYLAPYGRKWGGEMGKPGALIKIADEIRAWCDRLNISYLVVDSYTAATTSSDAMGGEKSATEYFTALQHIGRASETLAHVAASAEKFPPKPFGSIFIHNWSRRTWALAAEQQDDQLRIEFRNMKVNAGARAKPQAAVFTFNRDRIIYHFEAVTLKLADVFAEILAETKKPTSIPQIISGYGDRTGDKVSRQAVYKTLDRDRQRFEKTEGGALWQLATLATDRETSGAMSEERARTNLEDILEDKSEAAK
jgi:hypothetical protein